ncbi:zinc finger B-box domain-containing protein 1 isoform X3 [Heterocephalus glaber]|uniref:Zinc finger B-box domain-containing protein 1 isoform X3 n=1 Tax=Heterocephalus glaber TaxID=10181 RepID=A0AAX6SLK0_HETGA|nr:zinc finger B-box domain-containing protein 1 isoform X3 [Heterocephalus glaber]
MISQNNGTTIKLSPGKVKLKLLKQQLQEPVKQPINYKMANFSRNEKSKKKGKVCGQCENNAALLVCLECGEDYCSGCFAQIHQKGALKLHRTTLLQARSQVLSRVLDIAHGFIKEVNPDETTGGNNSMKETSGIQHVPKVLSPKGSHSEVEITTAKRAECTKPGERLLCEGSFDEEASSQSFQEELSQWRTENCEDQEKWNLRSAIPDSLEDCEVQTNLKIWREPLNVEFKEDSLSYMEKLWLKKHRRTPQEQLLSLLPDTFMHPYETSSEAQCVQNRNDEDSDVEETKVQYPAFFLPVEELNTERSETSIKIIELDDTYEEEFEEPGNLVPYKVELANADSQLRHTFHDDQKNSFPCEKDSYQHHIFNKVKTDLSKFDLPHNSTYYRDNIKGDQEWSPDSSLSTHADDTVALGVLQSVQHISPRIEQQKDQKSQRPSTANLPLSNLIKKSSRCLSYSPPQSRSAAALSLSRAASEISESDCIDMSSQNVPFLGNIAHQQSLDSSEKELNMLRNLEDPSEKLYDLTSEELSAFNNHSLKRSRSSSDFYNTSHVNGPCGSELSSSGEDTKMQPSLSLSESSTDEKEDLLDKQLVITASRSKSI